MIYIILICFSFIIGRFISRYISNLFIKETGVDKSRPVKRFIPVFMISLGLILSNYISPFVFSYWFYVPLAGVFLLISLTDFFYTDVYDKHVLAGFLFLLPCRLSEGMDRFLLTLSNGIISLISMVFIYYVIVFIVKVFNIKRIKKTGEGFGSGDVLFCFLFGATIGFELLMKSLILLPAVELVYIVLARKSPHAVMPAVPFIIVSGCIVIFMN